MKILFVGDVVGSVGIKAIETYLPEIKKKVKPQLTIVNGENAAGGVTGGALVSVFAALVPIAGTILGTMSVLNWKKLLK